MNKTVILHNIISPYKTLLFKAIRDICDDIHVLYIASTERRREWNIDESELKYSYSIMFDKPYDEIGKLDLFKKTLQHLERLNPELLIIDGYVYSSSWAGILWAKRNRKKVILWSSSTEDDHARVFYKEAVKRFLVGRCDAFNTYGTKSRDYLVRLGAPREKIFLIGNTTDNDFYCRETIKWRQGKDGLRSELGVPEKNFLYIGRFSQEKNILTLLSAYRLLTGEAASEWGLILLGSGPQVEEIQEYINANKLRNVVLPGFKQKDEIPKYFAVSDVLVLPSTSEPWGLVVNEAMAAGLPALVSRKCGCYPDIVKEGTTGFSFDPLDEQMLSRLMQDIVDGKMDLQQMGRNALEVIQDFAPAKAAEVVVNTIKKVAGEG